VQQLLVPAETIVVSGFRIESVYEPAQQVGGDFFQIVPTGDGGLLVVVGDVAGKGLPAAMLVSVQEVWPAGRHHCRVHHSSRRDCHRRLRLAQAGLPGAALPCRPTIK
jgi:hypothetical protein